MRCFLVFLLLVPIIAHAALPNCPQTVGTLTVNVTSPRTTCISPCTVFLDATTTTDSATLGGANNTFQDVNYLWNFSDGGISGKGLWAYGSHSSYSGKNIATGAIVAHLYIVTDGSGDTTFHPNVTVTDGTNTVRCAVPAITVYDPSNSHGFPGATTICYFNSTVGSGCPSGATQTQSSSFTQLTADLSGKRLLFKCGDTFTGDSQNPGGTTWLIGAYGACPNTQTGRPIFSDTSNNGQIWTFNKSACDGRIQDIDFEGPGTTGGNSGYAVYIGGGSSTIVQCQITLYNLFSNKNMGSFGWNQCAQCAVVNSVQANMQNGVIGGAFGNALQTSYSGNPVNNVNYGAFIGNHFSGLLPSGSPTGCCEAVRIFTCILCFNANNDYLNGGNGGYASLKLHCSNPNSQEPWIGVYCQYWNVTDNYIGGTSGAQAFEMAPQNTQTDERIKLAVIERNIIDGTNCCNGGRVMLLSAQFVSIRDNIFKEAQNATTSNFAGLQVAQRGGCGGLPCTGSGVCGGCSGLDPAPGNVPWPSQFNEVYHNTCYGIVSVSFANSCWTTNNAVEYAPGNNNWFQGNLAYLPGNTGSIAVVGTGGTGNTISNNTTTVNSTNNPGFTDASGNFSLISDFKPTANYTGGISLPVLYDALGVLWSPAFDLGAVHH